VSDETRTCEARSYAEAFGMRLRLLRVSLRMSQPELARILGTNQNSISRLERGINGALTLVCQGRLVALCTKQRVPLVWIYNGTGVMQLGEGDAP
jgi:transcriptional regulator with XRE-family HTH domain